jgi:hypothetical protein
MLESVTEITMYERTIRKGGKNMKSDFIVNLRNLKERTKFGRVNKRSYDARLLVNH